MTPCPSCGGPLERVAYAGGALNREQWSAVRAGDWCCERCPEEVGTAGRARTGYAYFWDHDVATPERLEGAREAMSHFLLWVYLEAWVCRNERFSSGPDLSSRERMLTVAIEIGLLRLEWPR